MIYMVDNRQWYKTKTAWGAMAFAALIVVESMGIQLPYEQVAGLIAVWTGYSVADRFRPKK